ncbi:hypothetical protein ACFVVU_17050 [Kitasatospora sp. NPDC057965]|uniref:hypothetical protein n=1 Tax=Kitasatospora sp. NPDC057965 TaxID=3346291 RepID=UPI0036DE7476
MVTVRQALTARADRAATIRIKAVPVEASEADDQSFSPDRVAVIPCTCVCIIDPCDCCGGADIWWLPADSIRQKSATGKHTTEGEELFDFDVDRDAQVLVQKIEIASIQALTSPGPTRTPGGLPRSDRQPFSATSERSRPQICLGGTLYDIYRTYDGDREVLTLNPVGDC